ncbi:MAG: FprA family A-type flavoprotein [Deltaproteobacteria bacterium]|nr:FprA family A-type flavoprotein [Deltaproteobacteria bacterium]
MEPKKIKEGVYWAGAEDWDRRLFDSLIPLPDGTSYNAYIVKGRDKTALIDTVDPTKAKTLLTFLDSLETLDYIIAQHAEQDHSGTIPSVLKKFPEAKVLSTPKGKEFLTDLLELSPEAITTVADNETLDLGGKTLEFLHTPWIHWPETMSIYLREDAILFTCDLFGSHLASSNIYVEDFARVREASKRYYAEVMMPFRATIKKHMERFEKFRIEIIAPSHGPVHRDPARIIDSHREWVSDKLSNTVVIPYATMHGSTEALVERLTDALVERGVFVDRFNIAVTDAGKLAMALVDAPTVVFGTPTILIGAHPLVMHAAFMVNALRPKVKYSSVIGSYGWGGKAAEQIISAMSGTRAEFLDPVMAKGRPKATDFEDIERLSEDIVNRHKGLGLL